MNLNCGAARVISGPLYTGYYDGKAIDSIFNTSDFAIGMRWESDNKQSEADAIAMASGNRDSCFLLGRGLILGSSYHLQRG